MVERARVFARTPMVPLPEEIYEKYSLSHWLQTVLKDPGKEPLAETQTPAECAPAQLRLPGRSPDRKAGEREESKPQGGESKEGAEPRRGGEEKGRCKAGDDADGGGTAGAGV